MNIEVISLSEEARNFANKAVSFYQVYDPSKMDYMKEGTRKHWELIIASAYQHGKNSQ